MSDRDLQELAGLFKERENKPYSGPVIGTVLSPPPELTVQLPSGLVLDKDDLIIAAHVLAGYSRQHTMTFSGSGTTTLKDPETLVPKSWIVSAVSTNVTDDQVTTDTIAKGDWVILIPTGDGQTFALIDKAVML